MLVESFPKEIVFTLSPGIRSSAKDEEPSLISTVGPNTMFVQTSQFARPAKESPNVGHGHHWYGNAESYFLIGDALGQALLRLTGN